MLGSVSFCVNLTQMRYVVLNKPTLDPMEKSIVGQVVVLRPSPLGTAAVRGLSVASVVKIYKAPSQKRKEEE